MRITRRQSKQIRTWPLTLAVAMCLFVSLAGNESRGSDATTPPPVIDCVGCRETHWADVALGAGLLAGVALIARWQRGKRG
jgi:hypothetical protein